MSAQLLYKMIKSKTEYPLHKAIKVEREDVVFLYLIEMDSQVSSLQRSFINCLITDVCYILVELSLCDIMVYFKVVFDILSSYLES